MVYCFSLATYLWSYHYSLALRQCHVVVLFTFYMQLLNYHCVSGRE